MTDILVSLFTPAVVWLASLVLSFMKKAIPDAVMTTVVIPTLSAVAAWVATIIVPGSAPWTVNLLLGFVAVFLHELTKNGTRAALAWLKGERLPRMGETPGGNA